MSYANHNKAKSVSGTVKESPKTKRKLSLARCIFLLIVVVGGLRIVGYVINKAEEKQHARADAEFNDLQFRTAESSLRYVAKFALIDFSSYCSMTRVDANFEFNAMMHKLKSKIDEVEGGFEAIDEMKTDLVKAFEKERYEIIRARQEANDDYNAYGEMMKLKYKHMVRWVNHLFLRHFSEALFDEDGDEVK